MCVCVMCGVVDVYVSDVDAGVCLVHCFKFVRMAGVTDVFWFSDPIVSHSGKADCGSCCRSSCGSNTLLVSTHNLERLFNGTK